jgi:hypothetical protein
MGSSGRFSIANIKAKAKAKLEGLAGAAQSARQAEVQLPPGGESVSVEKALNSRCTSDTDGDPMQNHWGMVDSSFRLSETAIRDLVSTLRIPRFSEHALDVSVNGSTLALLADSSVKGFQRECMMVEAGMQQQAVCLVAAALGVGVTIQNTGEEGTAFSSGKIATLRIRVSPMKPSYNGSVWSTSAPDGLEGNLPLPSRDGPMPLLAAMKAVETSGHLGLQVDAISVGQLLWAARGRTPHYCLSKPFGLTIPTWGGAQGLTVSGVLSAGGAYRYVNDRAGKPMHSLARLPGDFTQILAALVAAYPGFSSFLFVSRAEPSCKALWETGCQLLNILLQAHAQGIAYRSMLLDQPQKAMFRTSEIGDPVAAVGINLKEQIRIG